MSSSAASEWARQVDEAAFYAAAGGALAAATYSAAAATTAPALGLTGAELALAGAAVSWWMRRWPLPRALLFGSLLGLLAGVFWHLRLQESLGLTNGDPGMILALRMTIPLVVASYLLGKVELAVFALVPGVTVLGLAAGQGDETIARAGFTVFLPLALLAVGYAMLSPGQTPEGEPGRSPQRALLQGPLTWRARHWMTLGGSIIAIMALAQLIYLPVASWASAHRWQIITGLAAPGTTRTPTLDLPTHAASYAIGRGPLHLRQIPMLSFTGEYASYWRGEVYDKYLGSAWGRSAISAPLTELESFPPDGTLALAISDTGSEEARASHHVKAEADLPFAFYAPGQVVEIAADGPLSIPASSHVIVNGYGLVEVPGRTMVQGTAYSVTSLPLEPSSGRQAPPADREDDHYLTVPLEAERVAELARKVAGAEPSPERKLAALVGYLQQNCLYSTDAPAVPAGHDAVDYFLFHQKVGYCDLFASALAVMGRAVGVPTRLVTGYAFPTVADSGKAQTFVLRESDGHAWVEAYAPDSGGWITVDATPAGEESAPGPGWGKASLLRLGILWRNRPQLLVALAVAALLLVAGLVIARREAARRREAQLRQDWRAVISDFYAKLCRLLRRRGYARETAETPYEYLAALERKWQLHRPAYAAALPSVRALTETFVLSRYSLAPVTEETARGAQALLAEAQRTLSARQGLGAK